MNTPTDQELLRNYAANRSEAAFAELVRRHVDLVYSAALRMVREPHAAEDVTQGVFVALAQNARQLAAHPVLAGWLHRTARNLAANAIRADVRRQSREQEAIAMNEPLSDKPDASWETIAPNLDAALGELSDADRDVVLLRTSLPRAPSFSRSSFKKASIRPAFCRSRVLTGVTRPSLMATATARLMLLYSMTASLAEGNERSASVLQSAQRHDRQAAKVAPAGEPVRGFKVPEPAAQDGS